VVVGVFTSCFIIYYEGNHLHVTQNAGYAKAKAEKSKWLNTMGEIKRERERE
jgi:hypothetical protein